MNKTKNEKELLLLTKEFELKSKEMNKFIEKISSKEKGIDNLKQDIALLNTSVNDLENVIISVLKKRQRLSKKIFGVNNVE